MAHENLEGGAEDGSFIFARHTKRSDGSMGLGAKEGDIPSEKYPHVTVEGVEKAQATAREQFFPMIEESSKESVVFIGGSSEEGRTKATAEIIGEELALQYKDNPEVKVVTKHDIDVLRDSTRAEGKSILETVQILIDDNKNKKIVIVYPLYLKELSLRPEFRDKKTGAHTEFTKKIFDAGGTNEKSGIMEWFKIAGKTEGSRSPVRVAELQLQAIDRLRDFAKHFVDERPLLIGVVGHGWQLDALALYLANNGKVRKADFDKQFDGEPIDQAETGKLLITKKGVIFTYKGKNYPV